MAKAPKADDSKIDIGQKPEDNFEYKQGDEKKVIFMSYALLNRLSRLCPEIEKLLGIVAYPELQDEIMANLLGPKSDDGKPQPDKFDLERDTKGIPSDEIQKMIMWAVGHMSHFFIGLMNRNREHSEVTRATLELIQKKLEAPTASKTGSQA